jgi:hypothetical protein
MFVDVAPEVGITFRHTSGRSGRFYLAETFGAGCAFLDYNGDGRLDLFLVNSGALPGFGAKGPFLSALYENQGNGTGGGPVRFADVTRRAGLTAERYGMGCCAADYDNDGDTDLYLTAWGPNVLYRNNGDGTFSDVTGRAGVGGPAGRSPPRWGTSAAWLDYDRDGWLDLFVCGYCVWSPSGNISNTDEAGYRHMAGPTYYPGVPSTLYRNNGDGTFTDVTRRAGLFSPRGKALGVAVWDHNDDGWPDLAVACDLEPNLLYQNNGDGTLTELGQSAGVSRDITGRIRAGMGIDTGDYEGRGHDAVAIGNFTEEALALFRSDGYGRYLDVADLAGLREASLPFLTFGLLFTDYDLDGRLDLLAANGHIDENAAHLGGGVSHAERMLLFHNQGPREGAVVTGSPATTGAWFLEVGEQSGPGLAPARVARGLAAGDYDGDGDPDYLVSVNDGPAVLLRNDGGNKNRWLTIRTIGTKSNRDGIGTKVSLEAGGVLQQRWVRSGSSYASQSDLRVTFGLGKARKADRVQLRWPSGAVTELRDVAANQVLVVREGMRR